MHSGRIDGMPPPTTISHGTVRFHAGDEQPGGCNEVGSPARPARVLSVRPSACLRAPRPRGWDTAPSIAVGVCSAGLADTFTASRWYVERRRSAGLQRSVDIPSRGSEGVTHLRIFRIFRVSVVRHNDPLDVGQLLGYLVAPVRVMQRTMTACHEPFR